MRPKLIEIEVDETEYDLIEDFRSLTPHCRNNLLLMMSAAVQASAITGTVLDITTLIAANS